MPPNDYITVRDWRRRPPLRLRVAKKLDIHWCWIKCTRCPHMRAIAIAPYIIRWGAGRLAGHAAASPTLHEVRHEGRGATTPVVGRLRHQLGADADQPDGARAENRPLRSNHVRRSRMTLISDDMPAAFSPHPDLPPITAVALERYYKRYLDRGDAATALVLARLASNKVACKLLKEMMRRRAGKYVHPAGLVSEWRDPDRRADVQKRHREYLKSHPDGVKWREVRKWLESAAHNERWERERIVAEMLAMLAERVARSDAGELSEIARQVQKQRDSEALLRHLSKSRYPDHAAVFTETSRDREDNLNRERVPVVCELILAVDAWPMNLGYRTIAELLRVALKWGVNSEQVRYVIGWAKKSSSKRSSSKDPAISRR